MDDHRASERVPSVNRRRIQRLEAASAHMREESLAFLEELRRLLAQSQELRQRSRNIHERLQSLLETIDADSTPDENRQGDYSLSCPRTNAATCPTYGSTLL